MTDMKILFLSLLSITLLGKTKGQVNYSLDNDKALSVELLANLSTASISSLDEQLTAKGYKLNKTDASSDVIGYGFSRYNVFYIRRQIKEKLIDIQTRFLSEIWEKYITELKALGLTLQKTNILENGIEYIYANEKWYAALTKRNTDDVTKTNDIMLLIGPATK